MKLIKTDQTLSTHTKTPKKSQKIGGKKLKFPVISSDTQFNSIQLDWELKLDPSESNRMNNAKVETLFSSKRSRSKPAGCGTRPVSHRFRRAQPGGGALQGRRGALQQHQVRSHRLHHRPVIHSKDPSHDPIEMETRFWKKKGNNDHVTDLLFFHDPFFTSSAFL